jgi:hypothetical protein
MTGTVKRLAGQPSDLVSSIYRAMKRSAIRSSSISSNDHFHSPVPFLLEQLDSEVARVGKVKARPAPEDNLLVSMRIQSSIKEIEGVKASTYKCHRCKVHLPGKNGESCRQPHCKAFFCHRCLRGDYKLTDQNIEQLSCGHLDCPVCTGLCKFNCCAKIRNSKNPAENVHLCHFCR